MAKAVKCTKCGMFYNAATYSSCPHCQTAEPIVKEEQKNDESAETGKDLKPVKSGFIFGGKREDISRKTENFFKIKKEKFEEEEKNEEVLKQDMEEDVLVPVIKEEPIAEQPLTGMQARPTPPVQKREENKGDSLKNEISKVGKTVGKYMSASDDDVIEPVVGWLVCVKGTYFGQSFQLKGGKNKIGRGKEFDVKLLNDDSVSRTCMAIITFDSRAKVFSINAGESDKLSYLNGEALYERVVLKGYEEIEFGDSEKNKFIFIPLCGEKFSWSTYDTEVKRD